MIRRLFLIALVTGSALGLSSCGIVNHQISRAANLLRVPVRMTMVSPENLPAFDATGFRGSHV